MTHNLTRRAAAGLVWLGLGTLMAADLTLPLDPAMPGPEFEGIGAVSAGASSRRMAMTSPATSASSGH